MAALTVAPDAAQLAAAGGASTHTLTNAGAERLAFKVKSSNNNEYRVKPVFGFVEPGATAALEITRLAGAAKNDKMVVHFAPVGADATDAQAAFATLQPAGNVTIQIMAA